MSSASLQYNVSGLLKSEIGSSRSYDFAVDGSMDLDGTIVRDIHGSVKLTLTNFGIVATGTAHGTLELTCARCLEPFPRLTQVTFEDEFRPIIDIITGLPTISPDSDTAFEITQNHMIDLGEVLRQHFLLSLDLVPVCTPDCRGLCVTCGANLNTDLCNCPPAEAPNPFAVLQDLLSADHRNI